MYLFGMLWHRWPLSFKIITPMLHIAFSAAQFHGTRIFYFMWKKQERLLMEGKDLEKVDGRREGESGEEEREGDTEEEGDMEEERHEMRG